jgi:hypothetical protein
MTQAVETAVRGFVEAERPRRKVKKKEIPWRSCRFGDRVLVFDTETTTDGSQRLLYGFFRIYRDNELSEEAIFAVDDLSDGDVKTIHAFAREHGLRVYSREEFVDDVFYPEVYGAGALCVGFNLPFDLTRIAVRAGAGRGSNRRRFNVQLSRRIRWPRLHIESASARAAFIQFTWKKHLADWEKPFFRGRFADLSTLAGAFTGRRLSLERAAEQFGTGARKSHTEDLGQVTRSALEYGRNDVLVTWQLYEALLGEYLRHPFASLANEREQPPDALAITRIYSAASIAKGYLRQLRVRPFLEKQARFSRKLLGYASAAYYGGRAEVRVRRAAVPVTVVDFASMYPTVFILQGLQRLLGAKRIVPRHCTMEVRALLKTISLDGLYDPRVWTRLATLVRIRPQGDILPVRMRRDPADSFAIAVGPFTSDASYWYTLADVVAAKILGDGRVVDVLEAITFEGNGPDGGMAPVKMRGVTELDPRREIFKTVVEERNRVKGARSDDLEAARLVMALKIMANSGAYGIFAEVNIVPSRQTLGGMVHSDTQFRCADLHDERPGGFCNPLLASFVTGGARLMLALLETEVARRGGSFAYCDTDSLAIVTGPCKSHDVPYLTRAEVATIIDRFDSLNPYDTEAVAKLLNVEHEDVQCWAVSAKRYCLFRSEELGVTIVKASESGFGAILGRSPAENTPRLAEAAWRFVLEREGIIATSPASRAATAASFNVPLRRKLPLSKPHVTERSAIRGYNKTRPYSHCMKPFNFVQVLTPSINGDILPIAPFERDVLKSRRLPWTNLYSGARIAIDWDDSGHAGTLPVTRLIDYLERYRKHPETKAADADGSPSKADSCGVLHRASLSAAGPMRIGKEIDRLDEDDGTSLESEKPSTFDVPDVANDLMAAVKVLQCVPQSKLASRLGISSRRLRDIQKGRSQPRPRLRHLLIACAASMTA